MIISLVNLQSGVGKTTVAINLALALSELRFRVLLIDADPHGKVLQWQRTADSRAFAIKHYPRAASQTVLAEIVKGYTHTVIDAPPAVGEIARSILMVSDLVIIPVEANAVCDRLTRETVSLVQETREHNRDLVAKLLISKKIPGAELAPKTLEALEGFGIDILGTAIGERMTYVTAMIAGLSVAHYPHCQAAREIRNLCGELLDSL